MLSCPPSFPIYTPATTTVHYYFVQRRPIDVIPARPHRPPPFSSLVLWRRGRRLLRLTDGMDYEPIAESKNDRSTRRSVGRSRTASAFDSFLSRPCFSPSQVSKARIDGCVQVP